MSRGSVTVVTGGARSGKSRFAIDRLVDSEHAAFIATAEPFDDEMRRRIDAHREERRALLPSSLHEVDAPIELAEALDRLPTSTEVAVVDCLTVWLGNLSHHADADADLAPDRLANLDHFEPIRRLLHRLDDGVPFDLLLVTNEIGLGLVPADPRSRAFRDLAGRLNQAIAARADELVFMVSGLPFFHASPGGSRAIRR